MRVFTTFLVLLLPCLANAQRMPLDDDSGRIVQIIDGKSVMPSCDRNALERLATFLRGVAGGDGDGPELTVLGSQHLVALGSAAQIAAIDKLLQDARKQRVLFDVQCSIHELDADEYTRLLQPKLTVVEEPGGRRSMHAVLAADSADELREQLAQGKSNSLAAPRLLARPLAPATLATVDQVSYIRDYEIEVVNGKFIANPVVGVVDEGITLELTCVRGVDGAITVDYEIVDKRVIRPIPKFTTTLAGSTKEVSIELPSATTLRARQTAVLASGNTAVLAAKGPEGKYMVTLMTVTAKEPEAKR